MFKGVTFCGIYECAIQQHNIINKQLTNAEATPMAICSLVLQFKGVFRGSARGRLLK